MNWTKSIKAHGYLDKVTLNNLMGGPGDILGSYAFTSCLLNLLFSVDRFESVEFVCWFSTIAFFKKHVVNDEWSQGFLKIVF